MRNELVSPSPRPSPWRSNVWGSVLGLSPESNEEMRSSPNTVLPFKRPALSSVDAYALILPHNASTIESRPQAELASSVLEGE